MPKRLAILVCVSVLATFVVAGIAALGPRANPVPPQTTLSAGNPVAESDPLAVMPPFTLPEHFKSLTVRAEVSKELEGRFTPGTKVDVLLIPNGKMPNGQPERVLSGVFVLTTPAEYTLNEHTGEMVESRGRISLAVTDEQCKHLVAADERGTLRIVPAK